MTATATVSQVKDYLVDYLLKHYDSTPMNDVSNDRLLVAIKMIDDEHEGLLAMVNDPRAPGYDAGRMEENETKKDFNSRMETGFSAWLLCER